MLAEGDKPYLLENGFDATYPWDMFHMMAKVAKGERPAFALDSIRNQYNADYRRMRWNYTLPATMTRTAGTRPTMPSFPAPAMLPSPSLRRRWPKHSLIYSGQEEPVLRAIKFFDKDTIAFGKFGRGAFYKTLLALHKRNAALAADASFRKVDAGDDHALYAYIGKKTAGKCW